MVVSNSLTDSITDSLLFSKHAEFVEYAEYAEHTKFANQTYQTKPTKMGADVWLRLRN